MGFHKVIDFGEGLSKEEQAKIFDRFYRVDKARSRKTGGTGLGLSIAFRLSEVLGGKIEVESEPGAGASFIFRFPS
ncbi:sensor histidine kinase [Sinobaca sp. H24]|uniref:sensor histidine kinase n=1 Tax=Sinobaca sp. H24 TaxID=2923376 RepID=UPI0035AE7F72